MRFNNKEIENEYYRLQKMYSDIPEIEHPLINVSDTLKAYFALADYFTDSSSNTTESMLVGIRSMDLLCSALSRQNASFDCVTKYKNPIDICSTLFYGMTKNHSFTDGNKRTALLILIYQATLYGYLPNVPVKKFEKLVIAVAANDLKNAYPSLWKKYKRADDPEIKTISHFLRKSMQKKNHSYHIRISTKEMKVALEHYGVIVTEDNGKLHFTRKIPAKLFHRAETLNYSIPFGGWTRSVGPSTARDILQNLKIYDQLCDYQSFLDGNELFYNLIEDFEGPLRRLKDE